tara:strand:+ start:482 stop:685 length:204 start_codon:yes stop_codon:yes gene_type:complete
MTKEEMVSLLRSAGVDENAVNLAVNAWEMGVEWEREECLFVIEGYFDDEEHNSAACIASAILSRKEK